MGILLESNTCVPDITPSILFELFLTQFVSKSGSSGSWGTSSVSISVHQYMINLCPRVILCAAS